MSRIAKATVGSVLMVCVLVGSIGCLEFALLLQGALPPTDSLDGGANVSSPNDTNGDDTAPVGLPSVILRVSNSNPTVGEQITLTCDVQGQAPTGTRYSFSDSSGRLNQSPSSSTASLTISESDIGVQFQFRCSASFPDDTSSDSGTISVIPSG